MIDAGRKLVYHRLSIDISEDFGQEAIKVLDCWINFIKNMTDSVIHRIFKKRFVGPPVNKSKESIQVKKVCRSH